jgi:hypothetical protein
MIERQSGGLPGRLRKTKKIRDNRKGEKQSRGRNHHPRREAPGFAALCPFCAGSLA